MHPQTHILIPIEGFSLSASSQVTLSFKPRLLRISTPGQVFRPFHSLLTSRVSRRHYGLSPFRPICHISAEFSTCFYHITHYVNLGTQLSLRLLYRLGASIWLVEQLVWYLFPITRCLVIQHHHEEVCSWCHRGKCWFCSNNSVRYGIFLLN